MDRPNVNWKFYEHIESERVDDLPSLINSGSCNLHVVNGGFRCREHKLEITEF